jgi:hypothetical protein
VNRRAIERTYAFPVNFFVLSNSKAGKVLDGIIQGIEINMMDIVFRRNKPVRLFPYLLM